MCPIKLLPCARASQHVYAMQRWGGASVSHPHEVHRAEQYLQRVAELLCIHSPPHQLLLLLLLLLQVLTCSPPPHMRLRGRLQPPASLFLLQPPPTTRLSQDVSTQQQGGLQVLRQHTNALSAVCSVAGR
jgi:hypothetical protein